ncbi:MAG: vitamin B12-dependent ribonucleotide reductase [Clostridiales bacterium]|jgi:ribonucleoside-diphosphate reductase alpha chain|nr:vitamin B12-dependent ribonucleotide reductase [Clostridiales bacterium]
MILSENALAVLEKRYLVKDPDGNIIETPEQLFRRVSTAVASAEKLYDPAADTERVGELFYDMMTGLRFLPNSPTLMNAGRDLGQLSACFVLPVGDSMNEIFEAVRKAALIHKSGGGTGFSFSRLRPKGSAVRSTGGVASGPVSFMRVFNAATEAVKQGGTRRGANMGMLRVDHPDLLEFISCKSEGGDITNFNISVAVTEEFMKAAEEGRDYDLIDPNGGRIAGRLNAREVLDKIVDSAWRNGEPGIVFIDRLNRDNITPSLGSFESTNPCGEQPLLPYESCNLGSVNLSAMLKDAPGGFEIDYDALGETVDLAVRFLDNVIDINKFPLEEIERATKLTRKIGLGVMGFADMLLKLGIPYDSDEGVQTARDVMSFIRSRARAASKKLAAERGEFPMFPQSTLSGGPKMRNGTVTTVAPTGTLSIIAGVSSGVEPVFAYAYVRRVMDTELLESSPVLLAELKKRGLFSDELMRRIAREGSLSGIDELPEEIRRVFVTAHDITPEWHIRMQAAFQEFTDNAVSKTVNFPANAERADVERVFLLARELGCKGVTIYRDGSRDSQVLNIAKTDSGAEGGPSDGRAGGTLEPRPRPQMMHGVTEQVKIGCGKLYVTVNYDEHGICEVFTNTGRHGGCPSQSEATGRLASIALRSGISLQTVIKQLKGIRCPSTIRQPGMEVLSCPDAIARTLEKVSALLASNGAPDMPSGPAQPARTGGITFGLSGLHYCPECGDPIEHEGGCVICRRCGYSKCG